MSLFCVQTFALMWGKIIHDYLLDPVNTCIKLDMEMKVVSTGINKKCASTAVLDCSYSTGANRQHQELLHD